MLILCKKSAREAVIFVSAFFHLLSNQRLPARFKMRFADEFDYEEFQVSKPKIIQGIFFS